MFTDLTHVTVLVDDQDEALEYYTETLGFEAREDSEFGPGMRWVTVGAPGGSVDFTLVPADSDEKRARVGSQVGDHVAFVLGSDDVRADYERLREAGVEFHGDPEGTPWGVHVVFEDRYGNVFDLVEAGDPEET